MMDARAPTRGSKPVSSILWAGLVLAILGFVLLVVFLGGITPTSDVGGFLIPLIGVIMIVFGVQLVLMAGKIRRT
jgi:formate hydrogenlyase subunit 3/multisubunit Na+/H+ antiporter MnhD subunit